MFHFVGVDYALVTKQVQGQIDAVNNSSTLMKTELDAHCPLLDARIWTVTNISTASIHELPKDVQKLAKELMTNAENPSLGHLKDDISTAKKDITMFVDEIPSDS